MKTDTAAVVVDIPDIPYLIQVNRPVIAYWPNRVKYYPVNIVGKDSENGLFHVLFDDGDIRDEYYYQMRMLPYSC